MNFFSREVSTFCQMMGVLQVRSHPVTRGVQFSRTLCWSSFLLTSFQLVCTLYAFFFDFEKAQNGQPIRFVSKTSVIAVVFDQGPLMALSCTIFLSGSIFYPRLTQMFLSLKKVDGNLRYFGDQRRCRYVFIFLVYLTGSFGFTTYVLLTVNPLHYVYIPSWTVYYGQLAVLLCFRETTRNIAARFKIANDRLRTEVIKQSFSPFSNSHQCLPFVEIASGKNSVLNMLRLEELTNTYWLLCECVHDANAYFGLQLLMSLLSSFFHIISALFCSFLALMDAKLRDENMAWMEFTMHLTWAFNHLTFVTMLVWSSSKVTEAADATAPLICKLMNRGLNIQLKDQLESFLLQLDHHNARFCAFGFFQINKPILTSMAATATTYLVIMIQFHAEGN